MPANVTVVEADALEADLVRLAGNPFHLVGNLPYNIATPLLKQFISAREHILDVTIMLQKEVADRSARKRGFKGLRSSVPADSVLRHADSGLHGSARRFHAAP